MSATLSSTNDKLVTDISANNADAAQYNRILHFLGSLSSECDLITWMQQCRSALLLLLSDVDKVSINVNRWPQGWRLKGRDSVSAMHVYDGTKHIEVVLTDSLAGTPSDRIIRSLERAGLNVWDFQPPECFDYSTAYGEHIGSILLWRKNGSEPISRQTVDLMNGLERFFSVLLATTTARLHARHRTFSHFVNEVHHAISFSKLSTREREVFLNSLYGNDVVTTAKMLSLSISTVRTHVKAIRRKLQIPHGGDLVASLAYRDGGRSTRHHNAE